ncbi:MAG: RNA pseudouridine synthase [Rhabdochlamydiaceae bacterium]|nr:RNA pseudouridine synthase [Rhabdochlamydiaceae bacterium]
MDVIFVDNHLLVVNKPAALATQPHGPGVENLTDQAKAWVKRTYAKPGNVFLEPIHRLDKPVSGLVLFARTSKALSRLQEKMRARAFVKTYYALVDPMPKNLSGHLEHYLVHDEYRARVVTASHPQGKRARLSYKVIEDALLEIDLETGRYHQIRAQFAQEGCPIIGDVKYGSTTSWKKAGIALHHGKLSAPHPITQEHLLFTCAPPWN